MVNISVENINKTAPYEVAKDESKGFYMFETRYGVQYGIRFDEDDLLGIDGVYQFVIANLNNKKSPRDKELQKTITAIVYEFFEINKNTLLYICETGDGKQDMRNRLFEAWFESIGDMDLFAKYSAHIFAEGTYNHASIILRYDNPDFNRVVSLFLDTVHLLENKPQS